MLDDILKRDDVYKLLVEICNNDRYFKKKNNSSIDYLLFVEQEQTLFLFYDALFKYKIIIEDIDYFDDYLEQLDKLFKKIDNIHDIVDGINRILGKMCSLKLGLDDMDSTSSKALVLRYIYDKYIVNGYYIHGYSNCYYDEIKEKGFIIDEYHNFYDKFISVQEILEKHKAGDVLDKDFLKKSIFFTDNMVMGCYYAVNSPMYFYKLICKNRFMDKGKVASSYFRSDYEGCLKSIQKLCYKLELNEEEKKIFYDAFKSEWELLDRKGRNISLLLVPRKNIVTRNPINIELFIQNSSDSSLGDCIGRMIGSRNNSIEYDGIFDTNDIILVNLLGYDQLKKNSDEDISSLNDDKIDENISDEFAFSNVYGKVSILLLIGSILITLGVILTIIMVSKEML